MATSPLSSIMFRPQQRHPLPLPLAIQLPQPGPRTTNQDGAQKTELGDGSVLINLRPDSIVTGAKSKKFDANLAMELSDEELSGIASDLLRGIDQDDQSRQEWLETHAEGIKLLGLIIEDSRGDIGTTSAPLEGMSRYYHPLLLEAVLMFQANARGELLPAAGPVKVRDDQAEQQAPVTPVPGPAAPPPGGVGGAPQSGPPVGAPPPVGSMPAASPAGNGGAPGSSAGAPPPFMPGMGHNGGPPLEPEDRGILAEALEKDFNHYLTVTATEYYPDTDRMLGINVGFGGIGVKKVYNCPLRRRPVSESIPIEDFIVSNALTDLGNAQRITHRSKMKPSTLRRLQLMGVYRDVMIGQPTQSEQPDAVLQVKAEVQGVQVSPQDPKDADYTILECYCELELDEYAPAQFRGKGLRLPYRVTLEKDSRKILEIRRNWKETDKQCMAREFFVVFLYVPGFGFYGIGLLHILGNTTKAVTAICREFIDSGMFANFPGFIYSKGAGRQLTNQFRIPPGGGIGLDVGLNKLQDSVMSLPYKSPDAAFQQFEAHLEQLGQRLGGTANIQVGEGKQDAPVGTTLALIEQATKPTGAVMKRLFQAQGKEFILLKERFLEDPEAFWRFNRKPAMQWQKDQLVKALTDYDLVPTADPNNPTHLQRLMKAEAYKGVVLAAPALFDPRKATVRYANEVGISDIESTFAPPQPPGPPPGVPIDPNKQAQIQAQTQGKQADLQAKMQESQMETQRTQAELQDRVAERQHQLQIAQMELDTEKMRLASTLAIHSDKMQQAREALSTKIGADIHQQAMDHAHQATQQARDHLHSMMTQPPEPQEPTNGQT